MFKQLTPPCIVNYVDARCIRVPCVTMSRREIGIVVRRLEKTE